MTAPAPHIPTLETERLILRAPRPEDFEPFAAFYASPRSHVVGGPLDRDRAWRQLAAEAGHWTLRGYGRWIVEPKAGGGAAGMVGLWAPEGWPEPEVGWDLFDGHEGRGYATEAAQAARAFAYDRLGMTTLISLIAPGNTASARVAERLGARSESTVTLDRLGRLEIWRHPSPAELAA